MAYVRSFCDEIIAVSLSNIVGRCDKVASGMAEDEAALFLDDDPSHGAGIGESDTGEDVAMPAN